MNIHLKPIFGVDLNAHSNRWMQYWIVQQLAAASADSAVTLCPSIAERYRDSFDSQTWVRAINAYSLVPSVSRISGTRFTVLGSAHGLSNGLLGHGSRVVDFELIKPAELQWGYAEHASPLSGVAFPAASRLLDLGKRIIQASTERLNIDPLIRIVDGIDTHGSMRKAIDELSDDITAVAKRWTETYVRDILKELCDGANTAPIPSAMRKDLDTLYHALVLYGISMSLVDSFAFTRKANTPGAAEKVVIHKTTRNDLLRSAFAYLHWSHDGRVTVSSSFSDINTLLDFSNDRVIAMDPSARALYRRKVVDKQGSAFLANEDAILSAASFIATGLDPAHTTFHWCASSDQLNQAMATYPMAISQDGVNWAPATRKDLYATDPMRFDKRPYSVPARLRWQLVPAVRSVSRIPKRLMTAAGIVPGSSDLDSAPLSIRETIVDPSKALPSRIPLAARIKDLPVKLLQLDVVTATPPFFLSGDEQATLLNCVIPIVAPEAALYNTDDAIMEMLANGKCVLATVFRYGSDAYKELSIGQESSDNAAGLVELFTQALSDMIPNKDELRKYARDVLPTNIISAIADRLPEGEWKKQARDLSMRRTAPSSLSGGMLQQWQIVYDAVSTGAALYTWRFHYVLAK